MAEVFVGVGSNQGDSRELLRRGLARLEAVVPGDLARVSSLYRTGPVGYTQQPDFLNAVALFHGEPLPERWLQRLLAVEAELGRHRDGPRWGPRCLDLDLLAVGARTVETASLTLPHPRLRERRFVLVPWAEIAPDFRLPDGKRIADLERACADAGRVEPVEGPAWAGKRPENARG
ncbi:hypothetical protein AN478_08815 [Thiohalorhabdus denitrificans]|uniref:2-amino-4-hydroxy-6-hydroxymethyldihydropteridine pyrophosphokinase n=1 Tax=Thiohalorhabdus denitrificans TaxID=381306 RepID=A0A0P9CMC6_9GAMM|nr:2-amino-4-hydroxy-6-hydroxymethyldihydropteridine diphosphokinase [Thiohalorhabdus denitrificans]KPV40216.1 hypothetical protein AN478_08815 [Thiohalorhabdus denitrificans]SCX84216.1 2-amino-4-hydroxy-6-hydroxymethyldihydropteridinediphosphokinase [Thiohalorhabdus denitrificans]